MTDMKEQDTGLVVTCIVLSRCYRGKPRTDYLHHNIRTTKISNLLTAPRLSATNEKTGK